MTNLGQVRPKQFILAGAASVAAVALFSTARPVVPTDDTNFVNDNGQTSGDIFTQNAQDQSTASGAGT